MLLRFLPIFCFIVVSMNAQGQGIVTASQVNGTWREVTSDQNTITKEFAIKALGHQKLKVSFLANNLPRKFSNTVSDIAKIEGTKAIFKPKESQSDENDPCEVRLLFVDGDLMVTEKGQCGWGRGISAEGQYQKVVTEFKESKAH